MYNIRLQQKMAHQGNKKMTCKVQHLVSIYSFTTIKQKASDFVLFEETESIIKIHLLYHTCLIFRLVSPSRLDVSV